jgi:hypothetical protein
MLAVFLTLALAVAADDQGLASLSAADERVAAIAWQLQTVDASLCSETAPLPGFTVQTLAQYQPSVRASVLSRHHFERRPIVQTVAVGGPANRAGLRKGDVLLEINGVATPRELPLTASYGATAKTQALIDTALAKPPLILRIMRGRLRKTMRLIGIAGCASRVEIVTEGNLNAQADGQNILITGSLVDFADNDDELATIIAHELAHNILHHKVRLDSEKTARGLFARFGRRGGQIRETEFDADRMAVWLLARAGYDVDRVVPFWMRLGQRAGVSDTSDGTHPGWNERIDRAAAAVVEVKAQRAAGVPLLPTKLGR